MPQTEILAKTNCKSMEAMVTQHQLCRLRHFIRMSQESLPAKILYGQIHLDRRSAGGQMKHYKDQLKTLLKQCNIKSTDLEEAAVDHSTWRQLCQTGEQRWEEERSTKRQQKQLRRQTTMPAPRQHRLHIPHLQCSLWISDWTPQSKNSLLTPKWMSSSDTMDYHKQVIG